MDEPTCARAANIRNIGANSRPPENTMDTWRYLVYIQMSKITKFAADLSPQYPLRGFEIDKVKQMAQHYLKDEPFSAVLTPEEEMSLTALMQIVSGSTTEFGGFLAFTPGKDSLQTQ